MKYQVNHVELRKAASKMGQLAEYVKQRETEVDAIIQSLRSAGNTPDLEQVIASFENGTKQQLEQHYQQFQLWDDRFQRAHDVYFNAQTYCFAAAIAANNHCN